MEIRAETVAAMVATIIQSRTYSFTNEEELQRGLATVLPAETQREVRIGAGRDRIDFLLGTVGVEVKVQGSLAALTRQLHRYAQLEDIEALVVVTSSGRLAQLPAELGGKPVVVCHLLGSCL